MATWRKARVSHGRPSSVLFLDRDGVVIVDHDYLSDPADVVLLPGAAATIKRARKLGLVVVGVSNQSGLGRGLFAQDEFEHVMEKVDSLLAEEGAFYDGFYYCPHGPQEDCGCRKPRMGLLDEVAQTLPWDPATSWIIGDKKSDVALARRAKMGGVLVSTGYGSQQMSEVQKTYTGDDLVLYAADISAALAAILECPAMEEWGGDQ